MCDRDWEDAIQIAFPVGSFVTVFPHIPGEYADLVVIERHAVFGFAEQYQIFLDFLVAVLHLI